MLQIKLDLPREVLQAEKVFASPSYQFGPEAPLPPDPDADEVRFIEPVTLIATVTMAMLAARVVQFALTRMGQGVLIDARETPAHVSLLAGMPAGTIVIVHANGRVVNARPDQGDANIAELIRSALKPSP